ncbi:cobalt-zinc-cadmium resistance protein CzcC precursor [bacterium BMS3Bbin12]|nr:cobalt-zinc-cadmium resistance protein CzcC precursor [bacterium BMS3Abin12]GBE47092.1 cobalt-zinc-cadmium resistance protein CzcC precursor [bacterium BMS3Bbin12]GBE51025.1 cobalt-zinc-cadmium resistance protein CzcC precursor [bacterium BMS3Bbin13]HDK03449.1 TolC family protein [Gammaproteobacteria bacterium]
MNMHFMRGPVCARLLSILVPLSAIGTIGTAAAQDGRAPTPPSPALLDLVRETLDENPGARAARAAVNAAEARVRGADRPLYNPQLEVSAEQRETRNGTLGLSLAIDWADKRGARTNVAGGRLDAARAEYAAVRRRLGGELLAALGRYHTSQSLNRLARQRAELLQRFLDVAGKRRRAGDLNRIDFDLARLARTRAALQLSRSASNLAAAGQALAAVVGKPRRNWPALPTDLPKLQAVDAQSILANLPELRAAQARVRAARASVALRIRERRPDPTVGLYAGQERAFRNGNHNTYGAIGLTFSIPLYVRNDFRAEVEAADAGLTQAEQSLRDRYRRARARLLSAVDRYRLSRSAWGAWLRTGRSSLAGQVSLLERIWQAGEMGTTDYLVRLNQTLDTRADALKVRGRLWTAWADWLVAGGRMNAWIGQARRR